MDMSFVVAAIAMAEILQAVVLVLGYFKIRGVEHNSNSINDKIVDLTRTSAFKAGKKEEADEEAVRKLTKTP